ncbi:MAG: DUF1566 domain-containing protein [Deltaproteobacteria bacterium]|nr:DUF1566 domain-containing protein [Deltaproteobacteria bacterium]
MFVALWGCTVGTTDSAFDGGTSVDAGDAGESADAEGFDECPTEKVHVNNCRYQGYGTRCPVPCKYAPTCDYVLEIQWIGSCCPWGEEWDNCACEDGQSLCGWPSHREVPYSSCEYCNLPDAGSDMGINDGSKADTDTSSGEDVWDAGSNPDVGPEVDADGGDGGCRPQCSGKCGGEDGCGNLCPDDCVSPETCGGGGAQDVCGCTPSCMGQCGGQPDGCTGACPDPCNTHGTCIAGTCTCNSGYAGATCNACDFGFTGYPDCAAILCGGYGAFCCDYDFCDAGHECYQGVCVSDTCTGKDDFTLCRLMTTPDRSYDICIDETCISPGCGDQTCNEPRPHFVLPDTGQRGCYDNSTIMTCTAFPCRTNGSPRLCGQDAHYGWDRTHNRAERFWRAGPLADQPIVQDDVTGLIWQGCAAGLTGAGCTGGSSQKKTWADALTYCDGLDWSGFTDWRLPDRFELRSIVDCGRTDPAFDTTAFPAAPSDFYWPSSSNAGDSTGGWFVDLSEGAVASLDKTYSRDVRCVRGVPKRQPARFSRTEPIAGEPIVADNTTGLVWQGCAAGLNGSSCNTGLARGYIWQDALEYCEALTWGNQSDWRLPSVGELDSIIDARRVPPAIDTTAFPALPGGFDWSSSSRVRDARYGWFVYFSDGTVSSNGKAVSNGVRCVRGGP